MPRATNYVSTKNLRINLSFNEEVVDQGFQPLTIRAQLEAITTEGGQREVTKTVTVGAIQAQPLTEKEIYTRLGAVTNLHTRIQTLYKELVLEAVNNDTSAA